MALVSVKGVVYDMDGNTPITSVAVNIVVFSNSGNAVRTVSSSTVNGAYTAQYDTALLDASHLITVSFNRAGSAHVTTTGQMSGLVNNVINPLVPA